MQLHFLGAGGYHPNDARQTACLMLPELGIILDAGTAMYRVRDLIATETLDIFLTHVHLDHCIGLTYLFDVLHERDVARVTVHGDAAKLDAFQTHVLAPPIFPAKPPCEFQPLTDGVTDLPGGGTLSHFPLTHPGGALGYRLDWAERSMAYVSDTTVPAEVDFTERIRGVDILVHECHFDDANAARAKLTGHSCMTPVCELAAAADVGMLVLVHINPLADPDAPFDLDAATAIFENTMLGQDNMVIDF